MLSALTQNMSDALGFLPGVGPKSAQRMALTLLRPQYRTKTRQLAEALLSAVDRVQSCGLCRNHTEEPLCALCVSQTRDPHLLCVVESPLDILAMESADIFSGRYFVLHGRLSPLDGIGPQEIGMPDLVRRVAENTLHEVILATNPTVEGRATASYIHHHLAPYGVPVSRLAFGVPFGGELEYLDGGTLQHAFTTRHPMETYDA